MGWGGTLAHPLTCGGPQGHPTGVAGLRGVHGTPHLPLRRARDPRTSTEHGAGALALNAGQAAGRNRAVQT